MTDIHSYPDGMYRPRWAADSLREAAARNQVVVLTGARQVGKSTLLRNEAPFKDWRYLTLDDFDVLDTALRDPSSLWAGSKGTVIDEVQKAPSVLSAIKLAVDTDPDARFVLSGSANMLLMQHVSESLAGRAAYHQLGSFTLGEASGLVTAPTLLSSMLDGVMPQEGRFERVDPLPLMTTGMMPRTLGSRESDAAAWWEGYVATYLERDLRQLSQVDSLPDFRRLMEALSLRQGQLLNQSEIARDVSISQSTGHRYINLLETSSLLFRLPAYSVNRTKRIVKSPKPYWFDVGLSSYLSGHFGSESLHGSREEGGAFEALVLQHIRVLAALMTPAARLHYWRTTTGLEVDAVLEHGRRLTAFEFKLSRTPRFGDASSLIKFLGDYPEASMGVVVHSGDEVRQLAERVVAVPWSVLVGVKNSAA